MVRRRRTKRERANVAGGDNRNSSALRAQGTATAVDADDLAGDPRRFLRDQEGGKRARIGALPETGQGVHLRDAGRHRLVGREASGEICAGLSEGAIALTLTLGASSAASARVRPSTAPLAMATEA